MAEELHFCVCENKNPCMSPLEKVILRKRPIAIQLSLYYGIGRYVSINLLQAHWGTKALDAISERLQRELPGLRGFSSGNLKKMRIFYEEWQCLSMGSPMANQLQQNAY